MVRLVSNKSVGGIGELTVRPEAGDWPAEVVVRFVHDTAPGRSFAVLEGISADLAGPTSENPTRTVTVTVKHRPSGKIPQVELLLGSSMGRRELTIGLGVQAALASRARSSPLGAATLAGRS